VIFVAVAFAPEQINAALQAEKYAIVMASGDGESNTVELGGVTVPEGGLLLLKDGIFDGEKTMHNSYVVSEGQTLTLSGMLICSGDVSVLVENGGSFTAYGPAQLNALTVSGDVYTEEGGMEVAALTVTEEGVLEIGSASSLTYTGEYAADIRGGLIATTRYRDGLDDEHIWYQSEIFGDLTPTYVLTTLVITEEIELSGENAVDIIIPINGSLCLAQGSTLRFKEIYREDGFAGKVFGAVGVEPDEDGYYTLTASDAEVTDSTFSEAM